MPKITYKVLYPVNGRPAGSSVSSDELGNLNVAALVEGGFLKVTAAGKEKCPACTDLKVKTGKEYTADQLAEHYQKDHPGLVAPAREEE